MKMHQSANQFVVRDSGSFLYENNRNSGEIKSGNFLPVQPTTQHFQPEDIEVGGNNTISATEQDALGGSNNSIIHCNFDMSSRGPGKHKRGRLH